MPNDREKHIVPRSSAGGDRGMTPGARPSSGGAVSMNQPGAGSLSVDIEDLSERKQVSALAKEEDVVAIAPSIPMKLIQPFEDDEAGAGAMAAGDAWGIKAVGADRSPFSGKGVTVAVLDTGINADHPAFAGLNIVQKDFTGEGNGDKNGHGSHCAGTIFGQDVNGTRIGVARGVKKVLIGKVLGERGGGSTDMIVSAIQWAVENGANVISMSLGIDFPGFVKQLEAGGLPTEIAATRALEGFRSNVLLFERLASLIRAQSAGGFSKPTILIAAAGNESKRDVNAQFEVAVAPPAVSEGIVSVAALGESPQGFVVAPFSNTFALVSGPGVGVLSVNKDGGLKKLSGTSMATPYVAGVAALWAEKLMSVGMFNSEQLKSRLIASGTTTGLKNGLDPMDIGAGMVQAPAS